MTEVTFNCGSTISSSCENTTYTISGTDDDIKNKFLLLTTEVIDIFMVLQNYMFMILAESGSDNVVNGFVALKCAA